MMEISDSVRNVLNGGYTEDTSTTDASDNSELGMDEFLNLFITELKYQDPLDPVDNNEFISQTSQFTQVEQLTSINDNVEKLLEGSTANADTETLFSASSFIGKMVEFEGNTMVFDGEVAYLDFDLAEDAATTIITIYDENGELVNSFQASDLEEGENTVAWDGSDYDGNIVSAGNYKFSVAASNSSSVAVDATTYGNGYVSGVSIQDGKIMLDLIGNEISADEVTTIRSS
jgi:flagellar basal-body rod modification protein FlgD